MVYTSYHFSSIWFSFHANYIYPKNISHYYTSEASILLSLPYAQNQSWQRQASGRFHESYGSMAPLELKLVLWWHCLNNAFVFNDLSTLILARKYAWNQFWRWGLLQTLLFCLWLQSDILNIHRTSNQITNFWTHCVHMNDVVTS